MTENRVIEQKWMSLGPRRLRSNVEEIVKRDLEGSIQAD